MLGLDGVGITNYRSFGEELQNIGPLGKINLLIGQNNVGKSNILNFFAKYYASLFPMAHGGSAPLLRTPD
jgi:AAA15 family ATPase/GTPase